MCEQSISPLSGVGIKCAVKMVFADRFGIDDVCNAFNTLQPLQGLQKYSPSHALSTSRRTYHHQAMIDLRNLVQLENLWGNNRGGVGGIQLIKTDSVGSVFDF